MSNNKYREYPIVRDDNGNAVRVGQRVTELTVKLYAMPNMDVTFFADGEPIVLARELEDNFYNQSTKPMLTENCETPLYDTFKRSNSISPGSAWVYCGHCEKDGRTNRDMGIAEKQYICSAFRSDTEEGAEFNMNLAAAACRHSLMKDGMLPIAPHLYFTQFLCDDSMERGIGMDAGLRLLEECQSMVVYVVDDVISDGMKKEIEYATNNLAMNPRFVCFSKREAEEFISENFGRT